MKQKTARKKYTFILRHAIIALILYYLLFLILDILSKGIVSRSFKISLLLVAALALAFGLTFLSKNKTSGKDSPVSKKIIGGALATTSLLIFLALAPHDILTAGVLALTIPTLFFINRKYLLK